MPPRRIRPHSRLMANIIPLPHGSPNGARTRHVSVDLPRRHAAQLAWSLAGAVCAGAAPSMAGGAARAGERGRRRADAQPSRRARLSGQLCGFPAEGPPRSAEVEIRCIARRQAAAWTRSAKGRPGPRFHPRQCRGTHADAARDHVDRACDDAGADGRSEHPHRSGVLRTRLAARVHRAARLVAPGVPLEKLPHIDAVLISHNHYDHLDDASVRALNAQPGGPPLFIVPLESRRG